MRIFGWICLWLCLVSGGAAAGEKRPVVYVGYAPEAVYEIINQAKLDVQAERVWGSTSERSPATIASVQEEIMLGRSRLPQSLHLLEKRVMARVATLLYLGRRTDHETGKDSFSRGTVTLVKEEGTWRLRHETWQDIPNPYVTEAGDEPEDRAPSSSRQAE